MPPSPDPFTADELGAVLVELSVLTDAQWQTALTRAAGAPDVMKAALDVLTRTPAHWAKDAEAAGSVRSTALTDFQVAQVTRAKTDGLPKLPRLLRWNDYLLIETLGKGGMGVVYKGWDLTNKRYVAIKRTHREGPEARKRLRREASLQKYLEHPNIARLYSREKYGNADLLVLEYLPGSPLNDVVAKRKKEQKPLPWVFVAELAVDLLDALEHAHGKNAKGVTVIHRDIKPANVMLMRTKVAGGEKYVPKLLDMGLAKWGGDKPGEGEGAGGSESMGEQLTGQFQLLGTPEYMPPEQWDGGNAAVPESDTYALGGTLYFALTAELPFPVKHRGNKMAFLSELSRLHKMADRPSVRPARPDVPAEFDRLIMQMMAVPPSYRGSPAELRKQFQALLAAPRTGGSKSGILPGSARPAGGEGRKSLSDVSGSVPKSAPKLVTPGNRTSGVIPPPAKPAPAPERDSAEVLKLLRDEIDNNPPPGRRPMPEPPPRPKSGRSSTPSLDSFSDPSLPTPARGRSIDSMKAGVRNVRASADLLMAGSNAGTRERLVLTDRVFEFVKDTARPQKNPVPLIAALFGLLVAAVAIGPMIAVWLGVMIAFAVGFAFVLTAKPPE